MSLPVCPVDTFKTQKCQRAPHHPKVGPWSKYKAPPKFEGPPPRSFRFRHSYKAGDALYLGRGVDELAPGLLGVASRWVFFFASALHEMMKCIDSSPIVLTKRLASVPSAESLPHDVGLLS